MATEEDAELPGINRHDPTRKQRKKRHGNDDEQANIAYSGLDIGEYDDDDGDDDDGRHHLHLSHDDHDTNGHVDDREGLINNQNGHGGQSKPCSNGTTASNNGGSSSTSFVNTILLKPIHKIFTYLYGNELTMQQMCRNLCLSITLLMIVGSYWLLRSLKDSVIIALCGFTVIPKVQMMTPFIVFAIVTVYNKLLDCANIQKHQFFYIFGFIYAIIFFIISLLLMHPTIGLSNQKTDPNRILGWIHYFAIESFGSIMTSLFWSFTNSTTSETNAKASYGIMVATAQIGSILGSTMVQILAQIVGMAECYFIGSITILFIPITMFVYISVYGDGDGDGGQQRADDIMQIQQKPKQQQQQKPGICEGFRLFVVHSYVRGIFAISSLFIVELAIVDYTMKGYAVQHFSSLYPCTSTMSCWDPTSTHNNGLSKQASEAMTSFFGTFGQITNLLTFGMSLLGTSAIIRTLGLRTTILIFPTICLIVVTIILLKPSLYLLFGAMILLKALSYALNNPTKEILYQPTNIDVKFKAKSWIDMFGARVSKAMGGFVTNLINGSIHDLVVYGSVVGMVVSSYLIYNAYDMGMKYDEYISTGYVVGDDGGGGNNDDDDDTAAVVVQVLGDDEHDENDENENDDENGLLSTTTTSSIQMARLVEKT